MARILRTHEAIRDWVLARGGAPLLEDLPDGTRDQILLQLTFGQHALNADENEGPDPLSGFTLASWDDWFKAFDAQGLALKVNDERPGCSTGPTNSSPATAMAKPPTPPNSRRCEGSACCPWFEARWRSHLTMRLVDGGHPNSASATSS